MQKQFARPTLPATWNGRLADLCSGVLLRRWDILDTRLEGYITFGADFETVRGCCCLSLPAACRSIRATDGWGGPTETGRPKTVSRTALAVDRAISRRTRAGGDRCARPARDLLFRRGWRRSEEHTSELQSHHDLVCRLLLEKKKKKKNKKTKTKTKE